MKYEVNGETKEGKAYSLSYDNDMMDGILIDFPTTYAFFSDSVPEHKKSLEYIEDHDALTIKEFEGVDIDWNIAPHSWVFRSVVKLVTETAEQVCKEASDES